MNLLAIIRVAVRALLRNRLRSFLTALGIIIGVAAVIAMVSIGEGAKARVEASFSAMGTNLLVVRSGSSSTGGSRGGFGSQPTLTWDDLKAIQTELASVKYAAPELRSNAPLISEEQNWTTRVAGVTSDYMLARNWRLASGSSLPEDPESSSKVVLLGQTVVEKLYGAYSDPVGQIVRIRNVPFEVIGVLAPKGQSPMGDDYDDTALVPVRAYAEKLQGGLKKYIAGTIYVSAAPGIPTSKAENDVANLLRDRHRIRLGAEDDFNVRNLAEMASAQEESTSTLTTLLAAIAAVSLLVGGIGVMNIMLVSVTERTREIGVRMAVGARPRDILMQFLVEALVLALIGGLTGVALGITIAQQLSASFGWPLLIRVDVVLLAVAVSAAVGIGFGLYPARKAAQLDPIEALRYE
ncbi:ABC transporter permease [Solimonas sp. K1W22B-7]|uniref:ABC transporter permease n=1 Tax=Solimonas sp. K1W22B-7 TaxID=2303331 RepID=UPI000E3326B8|nr:ABC transporter permease [Solimonas sp. K1W22B-7]AXQ29336.1 ABC transporter permease [Solimonas sp. K1W22B-7]